MIIPIASLTLTVLWAGLLSPVLFLLIEICAAAFGRKYVSYPIRTLNRVRVLVPAHNEESALPRCLDSLLTQGLPAAQITVIADRCTDRTADIARGAGAEVLEHQSPEHPFKGYGLAEALERIDPITYDVVIMVDGDSWTEPGCLLHLANAVRATGRPVQGVFLQHPAGAATPLSAISAFAFRVKNLVRPLGLWQIGAPCLLCGSGMAFPSTLIQPSMLRADLTAEDYHLTIQLARLGFPPVFCPEARISSELQREPEAASKQRARWERNHLALALRGRLPLMWLGLRRRQLALSALALELAVPPLAMLSLLLFSLLVISWILALLGQPYPFGLGLGVSGLFGLAISGAWLRFGRGELPFHMMLMVPWYAVRKLPLYLNVLMRESIRTLSSWRQRSARR